MESRQTIFSYIQPVDLSPSDHSDMTSPTGGPMDSKLEECIQTLMKIIHDTKEEEIKIEVELTRLRNTRESYEDVIKALTLQIDLLNELLRTWEDQMKENMEERKRKAQDDGEGNGQEDIYGKPSKAPKRPKTA